IAADSSGNAYVTGQTLALNYVTTSGALQTTFGGGTSDGFLTKLTSSGAVSYSTYLGGSGADSGNGVAVDGSGDAFVTGESPSFPTTSRAYSGTRPDRADGV